MNTRVNTQYVLTNSKHLTIVLQAAEESKKDGIAERLYSELPETSFTRSISNPEAVMRRRRKQILEKKLQQFCQEGGTDAGMCYFLNINIKESLNFSLIFSYKKKNRKTFFLFECFI